MDATLFRALAVLRLVLTGYAVALNALRLDELARPALTAALVGVLVVWSGAVTWLYARPSRRHPLAFVADVAVAVALVLTTPLVHSAEMLDRHAATVPSFWVMVPVLAVTLGAGWLPGLVAAGAVSVADLSVRTATTGATWGNIFLLLLAAAVVGYTAGLLRDASEARAAAERAAASYAERARLSRAVHDGVLQVLALVQRRGAEAGGDLADLGRLAGEQEAALRALLDSEPRAATGRWRADLVTALRALASARVSVSAPAQAVELPARDVEELVAAVRACLENVERHVGEDAPAWVLVEDLGATVAVSVRDEGPGIPPGRLERALAEGRLGVHGSVVGRLADLGGEARLVTAPGQGTEWELSLPRR